MKETEDTIKRQAEFIQKHTLTEQDKHKLIEAKLERALEYYNAFEQRERHFIHDYAD